MPEPARRDLLVQAVVETRSMEGLRVAARDLLRAGVPAETLVEDLEAVRSTVPTELEDVVLDVMDLLAGWCAPTARLTAHSEF